MKVQYNFHHKQLKNKSRTNKVVNPRKFKGLVTRRKTTPSVGNFFIVSLSFHLSQVLFSTIRLMYIRILIEIFNILV